MLAFFRRLINSRVGVFVTMGVLAVIALAFALGDVAGLRSGSGGITGNAVASVDGQSIGAAELRRRTQDELEQARQQQPGLDIGQFVSLGGVDAVLDRLLNSAALQAFAGDQGMVIGKRLVDSQIASFPAFQGPTGKFDQTLYDNILAQRRLTDAGIRADLTRDMLVSQLILPTQGASQVPQGVALPYASLLLEKRAGEIGFVPTKAMPAGAAPSDAELQAFYRANIARYTTPERRVIRYALVTPETVKARAVPTEAEIAQAYRQSGAKYQPTEKRTVTQVTVLTQAAAQGLAAKVKGGQDLGAAARAAGLEPRTLRQVDKPALTAQAGAPLANAVFGAARGAVVGPVQASLGYVVARVDAVEQVPGKSLDQARAEIAAALAKQKSADALGRVHDALDDALGENANFSEAAADQKLTAQATPALTAQGTNPDDPAFKPDAALAPILQAGFSAEEGDTPTLVQTAADGSFALVGLDRIVRAAPRPLAQVRAQVVADFTADRGRKAAQNIAKQVAAKVGRGTPLAQALRETGLALPASKPLATPRAALSGQQRPPAPLVLLFAMAPGTAKTLEADNGQGWYVIRLNQVTPGNAAGQPQVVGATRQDLGRVFGREYVQQFTEAVKRTVNARRNDTAVAELKRELTGQGGSDRN